MVKIRSIFLFLIVISLLSFSVYAPSYGLGRYNIGSYGLGEDSGGGGGGGGGGSGGGGGGSGSANTASVTDGGESTVSVDTPNDLLGDPMESSFDLSCLSDSCSVTVNEVAQDTLPEDATGVVVEAGGEFLAAVQLECTGDVGSSSASLSLSDLSEDTSCDDLKVTFVHDGGSKEEAGVECSDNRGSGGNVEITASFSGCSYLVVWKAGEEVAPTVPVEVGGEEVGVSEEGAGVGVQSAVGTRFAGIVGLLVALVVIIIVGYFVFKKKKRKF